MSSAASFRTEKDLLGVLEVPAQAYYGIQTLRAVNNFQSNWQKWGFKSDNDPKLFQSALQVTLGTHQKTQAREDLKSAMRANGSKVTARPTHTTSAPLDGRERAATNADRHPLFRRNG